MHLAQESAEARQVAVEIGRHHHRVDEIADDIGEGGIVPAHRAGPDQDPVLAAVAAEQHLIGRQQQRERGDARRLGEILDRLRQLAPQGDGPRCADEATRRRPRPVERQVQRRDLARQPVLPVGPQPLALGTVQQLLLLLDMVAVGDGERRQGRRSARGLGGVELLQLVQVEPQRPTVIDDVMHRDQQHVVVRCTGEQLDAEGGAGLQVEGSVVGGGGAVLQLGMAEAGARHDREVDRLVAADLLHRLAVVQRISGAQQRMPIDQMLAGAMQRLDVERRPDPGCKGDMVSRAAGSALVQEPQRLLAAGHRVDRDPLAGLLPKQLCE